MGGGGRLNRSRLGKLHPLAINLTAPVWFIYRHALSIASCEPLEGTTARRAATGEVTDRLCVAASRQSFWFETGSSQGWRLPYARESCVGTTRTR